jgi:hypothetical protein
VGAYKGCVWRECWEGGCIMDVLGRSVHCVGCICSVCVCVSECVYVCVWQGSRAS